MPQETFDIERYLQIRAASNPTFSPDGERIAFLVNTTGVPQVWSVSRTGGWPRQLTFHPERVSEVKYSPTQDRLIYSMDSGGNERMQLFSVDGRGTRSQKITNEPEAIHRLGDFSPDGEMISFASNREHPAHFHIYTAELDTGNARRVLRREGSNFPAAWTPDRSSLIIRLSHSNFDHDLHLLGLADEKMLHLTPHEGQAVYQHLQMRPDGKGFYLISNEGRNWRGIFYYDFGEGRMTPVVQMKKEIEGLKLSPDGSKLAYLVNDEGYSQLWIYHVDDGSCSRLCGLPAGVYGVPVWSPVRDELAITVSAPQHNPNLWMYDLDGDRARQLTFASRAAIPKETLVEPELVHFKSFDGLEIPAFYYRPQGASDPEKLPVVIDIHGGPESQRRVGFSPTTQYLVNRGYAVFEPNVRGSAGYGRRYIHLDDVEKRMDSVRDIRAGYDWLVSQGDADPDRVAVIGGSYGGFMVLACITEYPDLWAAAVDRVGIANFITFLKNTGPWRRHLREAEYGSLQDDYDFLVSISPIHKANRIEAPLFVIHGANDPRVPVQEAEQIVQRVRDRGGVVKYLRFEDEGHGLIKLSNKIEAYRQVADFFDEHVKGV